MAIAREALNGIRCTGLRASWKTPARRHVRVPSNRHQGVLISEEVVTKGDQPIVLYQKQLSLREQRGVCTTRRTDVVRNERIEGSA